MIREIEVQGYKSTVDRVFFQLFEHEFQLKTQRFFMQKTDTTKTAYIDIK